MQSQATSQYKYGDNLEIVDQQNLKLFGIDLY